MKKDFLNVKIGDYIISYDEYSRDLEEHILKVEDIEYNPEYVTETNPKGIVYYGTDLEKDEYGYDYIEKVTEATYLDTMLGSPYIFSYTSDNAQLALMEIKLQIEEAGFFVTNIEIQEEHRACRNAYGKEMNETDFDNLDPNSEEAWFDDYDFTIIAYIFHLDYENKQEISNILFKNIPEFVGNYEEITYENDYDML